MRWDGGSISEFGPQIKDDAFPHGVSTACGESYGDRRSVPNTTSDALRTKRWEQRAEFSASQPVQEPRTSAGSFLRVWPQRLGAAEGAMGGGKHFRIRPPDKEDAFPHGVSTACGGATPTRRSVSRWAFGCSATNAEQRRVPSLQ